MTAGDALTLLLNHFYENKKDIVPQFVILLLKYYSEENRTSIDISNIRQDLLVAGFSEEKIVALNEISEVDNQDYDYDEELSAEQKVRMLEKNMKKNLYLKLTPENLLTHILNGIKKHCCILVISIHLPILILQNLRILIIIIMVMVFKIISNLFMVFIIYL